MLCLSSLSLISCGEKKKPVHEHTLFDREAIEATCTSEGRVAFQECIYCNAMFIDGKEVHEEDVVLPIDSKNHINIRDVEEVEAKCFDDGMRAHQVCDDCGAMIVDGEKVTEESLVIKSLGDHTWEGLSCKQGDAYKTYADGEEHVIDAHNRHMIEGAKDLPMTYGGKTAEKKPYLDDGYYWNHRMEFATQVNSAANNTVTNEDGKWMISNANTKNNASFTRFAYGTAEKGYIGKFIMTYDFTISAEATVNRIGVKVVDKTANANDSTAAVRADTQSKLIGGNANEENNPERVLIPNTVYTFSYLIELTAEDQLIQIWNDLTGVQTSTISDLHFENIGGQTYGIPAARLLFFGEKKDIIKAKNECDHSAAYDLAALDATCVADGVIAHNHCPFCGQNKVSDAIYNGEVTTEKTGHKATFVPAKDSTCKEQGNREYYFCENCEHHFADADCTENIDDDYLLPLSTVHELTHVEGITGDCTHPGRLEHYHCSVCEKNFEDAEGTKELKQIDIAANHAFNDHDLCDKCGIYKIDPLANNAAAFGTTASQVYPDLLKNPGKWACQPDSYNTPSIKDNILSAGVNSNSSADKNKNFIRTIPLDPTKEGRVAYIGTFEFSFDLKITETMGSASTKKLKMGFVVKTYPKEDGTAGDRNVSTQNENVYEIAAGTTYRFTALFEVTSDQHVTQFNVRNTANSGAKYELSNVKFNFKDAAENTGSPRSEIVSFAAL